MPCTLCAHVVHIPCTTTHMPRYAIQVDARNAARLAHLQRVGGRFTFNA